MIGDRGCVGINPTSALARVTDANIRFCTFTTDGSGMPKFIDRAKSNFLSSNFSGATCWQLFRWLQLLIFCWSSHYLFPVMEKNSG